MEPPVSRPHSAGIARVPNSRFLGTSFFSPTSYSPICSGLFVSACVPEASPTDLLVPKLPTPTSCPGQNELSAVKTQPSASRLRPPTVSPSVLTLASHCSTDHMASLSSPQLPGILPAPCLEVYDWNASRVHSSPSAVDLHPRLARPGGQLVPFVSLISVSLSLAQRLALGVMFMCV